MIPVAIATRFSALVSKPLGVTHILRWYSLVPRLSLCCESRVWEWNMGLVPKSPDPSSWVALRQKVCTTGEQMAGSQAREIIDFGSHLLCTQVTLGRLAVCWTPFRHATNRYRPLYTQRELWYTMFMTYEQPTLFQSPSRLLNSLQSPSCSSINWKQWVQHSSDMGETAIEGYSR